MPRTPDRKPGAADEEGIFLSDEGVDPSVIGEIRRNGSDIKAKDGTGVFNLRSGAGLTAEQHKALLQLTHFIDEGPAEGFASGATKEIDGGLFPTEIRWKRADTTLLVKKTITRSGGGATNLAPTPIVWRIYDTDGTSILSTVSDTISYSGVAETGRTRTIS
jgi:hypothetical protein